MKHITSLSLILLSVALLPIASAHAEKTILFKPPQLGAPAIRVGGGTRAISGLIKQAPKVQLLAAKQLGLTSSATPTLYWYAPNNSGDNAKITVYQGDNEPLLEKNISIVKTTDIQAVNLADYGINLVANQDYIWSITVAGNSEKGKTDLFANAVIRYTPLATPLTDVAKLAAAGYWYDTVAQLIKTKSPQLDGFLKQEGINIKAGK